MNSEGRQEKSEATLRKVKHMQNMLKKEGFSNKSMKDNIDTFEDVPAYVRRNMALGASDKAADSKVSNSRLLLMKAMDQYSGRTMLISMIM